MSIERPEVTDPNLMDVRTLVVTAAREAGAAAVESAQAKGPPNWVPYASLVIGAIMLFGGVPGFLIGYGAISQQVESNGQTASENKRNIDAIKAERYPTKEELYREVDKLERRLSKLESKD